MDHRLFNVFDDRSGRHLCPACGWPGTFTGRSYSARSGLIGSGICCCCYFEPGFDDELGSSPDAKPTVEASILAYRTAWVEEGMPWRCNIHNRPADWSPTEQLDRLLELLPVAEA
jgi:hypothetical protein